MTTTQKKIEAIHREFNTAGDTLLAQAKSIINDRQRSAEKAERLKAIGFKQANEVKANEGFFLTKETIDLIEHYQHKYPLNKFITRDQVLSINKKYNLVAGPIDRYTGFVPEKNLAHIEQFSFDNSDLDDDTYTVKLSRFNKEGQNEQVEKLFPGFIVPKSSIFFGTSSTYVRLDRNEIRSGSIVTIDSYTVSDNKSKIICAPKKDMDLSGLEQKESFFARFTTVHVPDPVVLQPVKGGYLIVTAWGDEASDPIVVNSINN